MEITDLGSNATFILFLTSKSQFHLFVVCTLGPAEAFPCSLKQENMSLRGSRETYGHYRPCNVSIDCLFSAQTKSALHTFERYADEAP